MPFVPFPVTPTLVRTGGPKPCPPRFFETLHAQFYADPVFETACPTLIVIPRFRKGGYLMVRVARPIDELYSLEFPAYQPGNTAAASKSILDKVFDKSPIELNSHTVQRLGRVPGQTLKDSVDIFITLIPDDTQTFELDCVEAPIRVHERLFHELVERGDITDGATLSAYAHLLARQGLLTAQAASPLFDRRRTPLRIKPRSEG